MPTRHFKLVPFNSKVVGDISYATEMSLEIKGRAKIPYPPSNLKANGKFGYDDPTYSTDIILTWHPRLRGDGAGMSSEVFDVNSAPIASPRSGYEGSFKIRVYVSSILVRTAGVDGFTWTYTEAMNLADNGSLPSIVVLVLTDYYTGYGTIYESDYKHVLVTKV